MCLPILRVVLQFHVEEILKGYFFLHIIGMAKFVSYQEALSNFQSQDDFDKQRRARQKYDVKKVF